MLSWVKNLMHKCEVFRWEMGYGMTQFGIGRYEYKVCRECRKATGEICNFVKDEELYK